VRRVALLSPLMAKRTGRPVRMEQSRANMFDGGRAQGGIHLKVGFTDDGTLTAVESVSCETIGIEEVYRGPASATWLDTRHFHMTKCKNLKYMVRSYYTNTWRTITNRGYRWGPGVLNSAFEAISAELGMDPTEVALKNIHTTEPSLKTLIEEGKSRFGWDWHLPNSKKLSNGKMHGSSFRATVQVRYGRIACAYMYMKPLSSTITRGFPGSCSDGKIYVPIGHPYMGIGSGEALAMVVAEETGAKYEDVIANYAQYDSTEPTQFAIGSRFSATAFAGKECAINFKEKLCESGASSLKVTREEVDTKDSTVYVKADPSKSVPFRNLGPIVEAYCGDTGTYGVEYTSDDYGARIHTMNGQFCEVEVDTDTGEVEITKLLGVPDAGKVINPSGWNGQIEGLLIWTIASCRYEDAYWDNETGVLLNRNPVDYKVPTILDCDMIDRHTVETRTAGGAYGCAGTAEFFHDFMIVSLAVHNAIGKWVNPPVTPEKVLAALGKA